MASMPPGAAALAVRSAGELALLGATFFAAGRRAAGRLSFSSAAEEIGVSLALGAGIIGTALFILAAAGELTRVAVIGLAVAIHAIALPVWKDVAERVRRRGLRETLGRVPLFPLIFAVPSFVQGLYPPWAFDETMYHLPIARSLAIEHSVLFLANLRNPAFPQLVESLDAAMMLLFGDVSTHRVEWLAMVATSFALYGFGRRWGGRFGGHLATAFWTAHPMVLGLGAAAYVDLDLALFVVGAYFAWEIWREGNDVRWLAVSGALTGFAAATKYLGLAAPVVFAGLTLASRGERRIRRTALLTAFGLAALAPAYLWIFAETHNPVFPYLARIFGHSAWEKPTVFVGFADSTAAWSNLIDPVKQAFRGSILGPWAPISPLWVVEFGLAAMAAVFVPRGRRAFAIALVCGLPVLAGDPRFLLPSLALLAFGASLGLESLWCGRDTERGRPVSFVLAAALSVLVTYPAIAQAVRKALDLGSVPTSAVRRSAFLRERLPGYGALEWLNRRYGNRYSVYFLRGENLAYFAEGNFMGDWRGPYRFEKIYPLLKTPRKLERVIRALGADFFSTDRVTARWIWPDLYFRRHFRQVYDDGEWIVWELGEF